ncbi:MAG TPA: alpha/beta fold hydrolase [Vicinamibacterales bacterium]|nr:alpha/beta fold hydrolase [Vicinamibacterales bacterium]
MLAALLLFGLTLQAAAQAQKPPDRNTVLSNGHPLAVWSRAPATPRAVLVLVHGRTWSSRPDFDLQVPGLQRSVLTSLAAQGIAAYAVDLRGYGETPRDRTQFLTPRVAAQDVATVLQWAAARHPSLPPPALLGYSLGGAVAHLAAQLPGLKISSLILFGFTLEPDVDYAPVPAPPRPARGKTTRIDALSDFMSPLVTPPAVSVAFASQALAADPVRMDWIKEEEFNELEPARLTMPTMILQGSRDAGVPMDVTARFFQKIAASQRQWTLLPGGDHVAQIENTHLGFVSAIVEFITRPAVK